MVTQNEYDTMRDQRNVALAKAQDLQEQLLTKQEQWNTREQRYKTMEGVVRKLCEEILAKDNREMVLGTDYSWSSVSIFDLINKAQNSLRDYTNFQKDFMRKLLDQSESRRQTIESLEEQISIMRTQPSAIQISQDELAKKIEEEKKKKKVMESIPPKQKEYIENGRAEIVLDDKDEVLEKE